MVDFENTEIAFQNKTDQKLRKAIFLFKMVSSKRIVAIGGILTRLALSIRFPIGWIIKPTLFKQFCGGTNFEESIVTANYLQKFNIKSILDYSAENESSDLNNVIIQHTCEEIVRSIKISSGNSNIPFAVFKPTAVSKPEILEKIGKQEVLTDTEKQESLEIEATIENLCEQAAKFDVPILIDAEDYAYQTAIDKMVSKMMEEFNKEKAIVYNTLQMYRWDRLDFLKCEHEKARTKKYILGIKLVRGAYMEKERELAKIKGYPSPIQPDKESTDKDFNSALDFCVSHINEISLFVGTHNEESVKFLLKIMQEKNISNNDIRIFFSQLYGMSDHLSYNLANEGYNVAKYVPYGSVKLVLPYLVRRAKENTSIAGQTGRELKLLYMEKHRRKRENIK